MRLHCDCQGIVQVTSFSQIKILLYYSNELEASHRSEPLPQNAEALFPGTDSHGLESLNLLLEGISMAADNAQIPQLCPRHQGRPPANLSDKAALHLRRTGQGAPSGQYNS